MKDSEDRIIYVGKAKNLKRRVQSYFQHSKAHPQKIKKMISNIKDFEYILTDTEFEAFLLECRLIKELQPLFNKKMKSTQSYAYILIHLDEELHRIEITNHPIKAQGKLYYGPYVSRHAVERAVLKIKEFYRILCSNPAKRHTPCLNYSLGLCIGTCLGGTEIEAHNKIIEKVIQLLNGTDQYLMKEIKMKMESAAEILDYETAAKCKEQLEAVSYLIQKEKVIDFTKENKNLVIIEGLSEELIKLFLIKRNTILFKEKYLTDRLNVELLKHLIQANFYNSTRNQQSAETDVGKDELDKSQIIYHYLHNSQCKYMVIPEEWCEYSVSAVQEKLDRFLYLKSPHVQR
nr:GIY-YIG nuclease family protein [Neobacillus sp. Marseille-Q6967]